MTGIGLPRNGGGLVLHTCASCGRHAWLEDGRQVDRQALLDALRSRPPARRAAAGSTPAAPVSGPAELDGSGRRAELQHLLGGFTAHGSSS